MGNIRERLPTLLEEDLGCLQEDLIKEKNLERNRTGSATRWVMRSLVFIGVAKYILNKDIQALRSNFYEAAIRGLELLKRFDRGDPISESYVAVPLEFAEYALVAGDFKLAEEIATLIGIHPEVDKECESKFNVAFGYALKATILQSEDLELRLNNFMNAKIKRFKNYAEYADALVAMRDKNTKAFDEAFKKILAGHRAVSKGRGEYSNTENELLCIEGIAMVNLAKHQGMPVSFENELIPKDLTEF